MTTLAAVATPRNVSPERVALNKRLEELAASAGVYTSAFDFGKLIDSVKSEVSGYANDALSAATSSHMQQMLAARPHGERVPMALVLVDLLLNRIDCRSADQKVRDAINALQKQRPAVEKLVRAAARATGRGDDYVRDMSAYFDRRYTSVLSRLDTYLRLRPDKGATPTYVVTRQLEEAQQPSVEGLAYDLEVQSDQGPTFFRLTSRHKISVIRQGEHAGDLVIRDAGQPAVRIPRSVIDLATGSTRRNLRLLGAYAE